MGEVTVAFSGNVSEVWSLDLHERASERPAFRLECRAPDGRSWSSEAEDVFECLMLLRQKVEVAGGRICCNGARLDAWSSGMQRDMGRGRVCYLLAGGPKGQRHPTVRTLDPTNPELAVLVADQVAWYQNWLGPQPTSSIVP